MKQGIGKRSASSRVLTGRNGQVVGWGSFILAVMMTAYSWLMLGLSIMYEWSPGMLSARWLDSIWLNPLFVGFLALVLFFMWWLSWGSNVEYWGAAYFFNVLCSLGIAMTNQNGLSILMVVVVTRVLLAAFVMRWTA